MEALADACERGEVPGEVVAVVADRPCRGIDRATQRGLATEVLEPKSFESREAWSETLRDLVLS